MFEGSKLGTVEPAEEGRKEGTFDGFTLSDGSLVVGIGDGLEVILIVGLFVEEEVGPGVGTFIGLKIIFWCAGAPVSFFLHPRRLLKLFSGARGPLSHFFIVRGHS